MFWWGRPRFERSRGRKWTFGRVSWIFEMAGVAARAASPIS